MIRKNVVLWLYGIDGCAGGNAWSSDIEAFDIKQVGKAPSHVRRKQFSAKFPLPSFATVKNISLFQDEKKSESALFTSTALVDALDWGDNDARCCPTDGRQFKIWLENDELRAVVIKRWQENR
jgi:hypothetical protein